MAPPKSRLAIFRPQKETASLVAIVILACLIHAGIGEQECGVLVGDDGRGVDVSVLVAIAEVVHEGRAHLVAR